MKTYTVVMIVLIVLTFIFGMYAANKNLGFIALLMGYVLGNLQTSFRAELKSNKNNTILPEEK